MALVGRVEQLAALEAAVASPPSVVFVAGEAGTGKTRLISELTAAAHPSPRWVSVGRCLPLGEPFPFGAVLDCLRGCGSRLDGTELGPVTGVLRPYLPEIADRLPARPAHPADSDGIARHQLFRAVRDLVAALGPSVLIIEDLHWADDGTRALLRFLLSDPPDELAVVLTYRPEEAAAHGPLGGGYRPSVCTTTTRIRLGPLDVPQVRQLASAVLGEPVPGAFAVALHEHTGGIPFLVEEVVRALPGRTAVLERSEVPAVVREAVGERLRALPADARLIVQAAAVFGEPADAERLDGLALIGAERCRAGIIAALSRNALVEVDDGRYGFQHALGRRAVYETLLGPHRQDLHRRAAEVLREREPAKVLHIAEHSRKAGRHADWLTYGEAAADSAAAAGDASTAIALLRRLLAEPELRSSDVDRLAAKLGRIVNTGLDQFDVTSALERLLFDGRMSDATRGEIRLGLGLLLVRQSGGLEASRVELELAAGELRGRPALAARCMAVLAQPYVGTTPITESMRWLKRVETAIAECDDPQWRTTLLANVLGSRLHTGDPNTWDHIGLLPEQVDSAAEQRELARAHCNLADACSWIGHYQRARSFLHTGLRLATDCGAPYVASIGRSTELHLDWLTGNWTDLADRATELMDTCHDLLPVSTEISLVLGSLAAARGDWAEAEHHLTNTGMSTPDNAITPVVIAAHGTTINLHLSTEDIDAAVSEVDRGLDLLRHKGVWAWAGELAPQAVAAFCRAGRVSDAAALVAELEYASQGIDAPLTGAALRACRAEVANARGEPATAIEHLRQARSAYNQLPRPYQVLMLDERIATIQLELGEQHDAGSRLADLADAYDGLGAVRDAARCRHISRTSGASPHPRRGRRGYGNDLSPRERDVARLLAGGRTNREIAEVLFLSRRTVEQHVARVLRKLNASSRHDVRLD